MRIASQADEVATFAADSARRLRVAAVCGLLGSVLFAGAGVWFARLAGRMADEGAVAALLAGSRWHWPLGHLGMAAGALLWLFAFTLVASTLGPRVAGLARAGMAALTAGVAVQITSAFIGGFALPALGRAWNEGGPLERSGIALAGETVLALLAGGWAAVCCCLLGAPFVLLGLAVARSGRYPAALGWLGAAAGTAALAGGLLLFLDPHGLPRPMLPAAAGAVVLFVALIAGFSWRRARRLVAGEHGRRLGVDRGRPVVLEGADAVG